LNNPRANIANLIAAGGAALLILSTFLPWIGGEDESANFWEILTLFDIVLFVVAILALLLAGAHVAGQAATLPAAITPSRLRGLGTIALTIALYTTIEFTSGDFFGDAGIRFGAILGVLAAAAILAGGILNERPDLAAKLNEATAGIGGGGGQPGVGAGPAAGQGGFGQPGGGAATPGPGPAAQPQSAPQQPQSPPQQPQAQPQTAPQPVQPAAAQGGGGESSGPAPGWYPDPQGQKRLRYWDGSRWTEQTSD
jgi:hypothetical protein